MQELRRGGSLRPFAPEIESAFSKLHLQRVRPRVRAWYAAILVANLLLVLGRSHKDIRARAFYDSLTAAVLLVPPAVLVGLIWTRYYERLFLRWAPWCMAMLAGGVLMAVVEGGLQAGQDQAAVASVVCVCAFGAHFLAGLMPKAALLSDLTMCVVLAIAAAVIHLSWSLFIPPMLLLIIISALAAYTHFGIDVSYRYIFLQDQIIRTMAARDPLTGIRNRRAFDEHLRRIWEQALRDSRQIAIVLLDIDHFKAHNDHYGHQAGDAALRNVALTVEGFVRRPLDLAARFGGEEFAITFYDVTAEFVATIAESIRAGVSQLYQGPGGKLAGRVTVSIGAVLLSPSLDRTIEGAVQFADEALYQAKKQGRDRVVIRSLEDYNKLRTGIFRPGFN